jgi:four helix bundle protein
MRDHQSLDAWQYARDLSQDVYRLSTRVWSPPLGTALDQLRRASLSIRLNLVEGYSWRPGRRWQHHLRIALGSAMETTECLRFLREIGAVSPEAGAELITRARRVERLIWGLLQGESRSA